MAQKVEAVPSRGFAVAAPEAANPWTMAQQQFDAALVDEGSTACL